MSDQEANAPLAAFRILHVCDVELADAHVLDREAVLEAMVRMLDEIEAAGKRLVLVEAFTLSTYPFNAFVLPMTFAEALELTRKSEPVH